MESPPTISKPVPTNGLRLVVRQLGHVPSKKNMRMAVENSSGKGLKIISQPESKEWADRCIRSFESQLLSLCRTTGGATLTADSLRSLIASLPADDAWQHIPEMIVSARKVPKGEEGAIVTIEIL